MDAAIRAPSGSNRQPWRFLLVDDADLRVTLAALYLDGWQQLNLSRYGTTTPDFDSVRRSADYLAHHFADVPLLLFAFGQGASESSVYPALWSAMLAARAEGVGTCLTTVLGYHRDEVFDLLGVPKDDDWRMYGCVTMGYPPAAGASPPAARSPKSPPATAGTPTLASRPGNRFGVMLTGSSSASRLSS